MASVGGLSSSTSNNIRGYGGLASGIDRDEMITNMTAATQAKIDKQLRAKQVLKWEQEAIRGITDKMYEFSYKYTSYANPSTNLTSSSIFNLMNITALGENSKYISISGSSKTAASMSILGVKQMAQNAKLTGTKAASDKILETGEVRTGDVEYSNIAGKSFTIKYGSKFYSAVIGDIKAVSAADIKAGDPTLTDTEAQEKANAQNLESTRKAIEDALGKTKLSGSGDAKLLSDIMGVEVTAEGAFKFTHKASDQSGNSLVLIGGSGTGSNNVLRNLGFLGMGEDVPKDGFTIDQGGLVADNTAHLSRNTTLDERFSNQTLTFSYNGTRKTIKLPSGYDIREAMDAAGAADDPTAKDAREAAGMECIREKMESELKEAFGTGRIRVKLDGKSFKFETIKPDNTPDNLDDNEADDSSLLSITSGGIGMLGENGFLSVLSGESNRVNMSAKLKDSGVAGVGTSFTEDELAAGFGLKINGKDVWIDTTKSLKEIMDQINNSGAKVKVSYQESSDKFVFESTEKGASGFIKFTDSTGGAGVEKFERIFGKVTDSTEFVETKGQDAVITVKYDSGEQIDVTRDSNSFTLDGLNITLKDTFGYKEVEDPATGTKSLEYDPATEAITFDAVADSENLVKTVKEMIEAYNEILEMVSKEVSTKPNRDYPPLTDKDKEEWSEEQIKSYEEKAKAGMLFSDFDLRSMLDKLRWVLPTGGNDRAAYEEMGITMSTDYSTNGKLIFDEEKFKAAFENDPDKVKELFTRQEDKGTNTKAGFMVSISNVMEQFGGTLGATKGVLIERAGSKYAPTSVFDNAILTEMDRIDEIIEKYKDQLEAQTDRYIKQFTTMEQLISQMNSQSSWLSSALGGA